MGLVVILSRDLIKGSHAGTFPHLYFSCTLVVISLFCLLTNHLISHLMSAHGNRTYDIEVSMGDSTEYKAVVYYVNW